MSRSYLVNLLVEIHLEDREDWDELEEFLNDRYNWGADFYEDVDSRPYIVSASDEGWTHDE